MEAKNKLKVKQMKQLAAYRKQLWKQPKLRSLFIEMTILCNEHCRHCGSSCGDIVEENALTDSEVCDFLKATADKFPPEDMMLCVTGGEPLLRPGFFDIMNYAVKCGYQWGMTTNATLITGETAEKLAQAKMKTVSVSIDGLKETHEWFRRRVGGFDESMNGIRAMLDTKAFRNVQVTTVVHKKNLKELPELYEYFTEQGIDSWRIINIDPIGRAKDQPELLLSDEELREMFRFIREKRAQNHLPVTYGCAHYLGDEWELEVRKWYFLCNAGIYTAGVLYNGDITACLDIERRPELLQGNIRRDDFATVWKNGFQIYRGNTRTCEKCKKCRHYRFCGGDAFHTWDFDRNEPSQCMKGILF